MLSKFTDFIKTGQNFQFVKFGDGEMLAMLSAQGVHRSIGGYQNGKNGDGVMVTPEVGLSLWEAYSVLLSREDSYFGSFMNYVAGALDSLTKTYMLNDFNTYLVPGLPVLSDHPRIVSAWILFHHTNPVMQPNIAGVKEFYQAIAQSNRPKVFIGPARLSGAAEMLRAEHVVTSLTGAFDARIQILNEIKRHLKTNAILMFSCGFVAKSLMADCLGINGSITCVDVGSSLDPLFVGMTRNEQLSREQLTALYADLLPPSDGKPRASLHDQFIEMIESHRNFQYVKFGDGEMISMMGFTPDMPNCDGSLMSREVGDLLWDAYASLLARNDVYLGSFIDWARAEAPTNEGCAAMVRDHDLYISPRLPAMGTYERKITGGLLLHSLVHPNPAPLFKAIARSMRNKILVGPARLAGLAMIMGAQHVVIPDVDACRSRASIMEELTPRLEADSIVMFCGGFAAKVLIADCLNHCNNLTCLDVGSSFDCLFVGETRTSQMSKQVMLDNYGELFPMVSIMVPSLGRPEGLARCLASINQLNYPKSRIEVLVDDRPEPTVPEKVADMFKMSNGDYLCYAANDMEFTPDSLLNVVTTMYRYNRRLGTFNAGPLLPDQGNICEHFVIYYTLIPEIGGEIFDTELTHVGVDNLLWAKASAIGEAIRVENAVIKHYHFSKPQGNQYDAIYARGWEHADKDRALLKRKLAELKNDLDKTPYR